MPEVARPTAKEEQEKEMTASKGKGKCREFAMEAKAKVRSVDVVERREQHISSKNVRREELMRATGPSRVYPVFEKQNLQGEYNAKRLTNSRSW